MLDKYLELLHTHPYLLNNQEALLTIELDREVISTWQKKQKRLLLKAKKPPQWADIGLILDDPYNIILRDLVRFPDGELRGYTRSIARASLHGGKGVVILPEFQEKILLLHQFRHPTRQWHYEAPRGFGEPNTPPADNARLEIEEETGGVISEMISLGEFHNNTGYETASVALFFARLASVGRANLNEGIESFAWLTVKELEDWIASEKITDGFTIAAFTKARLKHLI